MEVNPVSAKGRSSTVASAVKKKDYSAVKLRVDFFEDEPGKFSPTGKKIPGSSLKISTRIFTAG